MPCGQSDKKLCFHIVSDDNFFISGFMAFLKLQKGKPGKIFECKVTDCTPKSVHMISDSLNEIKKDSIFIVVANNDVLGAIYLSTFRKNHLFIDMAYCKKDFIEKVLDRDYNISLAYHHYITTMQMKLYSLTNKEKRICQYMAKGYPSKFIGMNLGIHEKTVSGYKNSIIRKIGCKNKIELYKFIITYFTKLAY
ncbi:helix-turn-helix transcriptional regulator [Serratia fonticola]|uniref:helix-turn-helix transcriptional regulator n=1 Tax=Serratia fonticola TaxID=47917 RepID=UPI003AAA6351